MPMTKSKSPTFPFPNMFMEPIQLGHQKFIHAFNFYVDFSSYMVCLAIFPYGGLNPKDFGYMGVLKKIWICHEAFLFLEGCAIGTINPSSLNSKLTVISFELGFNPKGIHIVS